MSTPGFASTSSLPDGWVVVRLADLVERLESGKRPKGGVRGIKEGVPSIGGEHLTPDGGFDFSSLRYVPEEFFDSLSKGRIAIGDILVVKDGATTGKVALVRSGFPLEPAAVNEHVFLLRPARGVSPHYLFWYLWSEAGQRAIRNQVRGAAQGGIVRAFADAVRVPLPPRAEQDRIVEAIESAMAAVDAGVRELDEATSKARQLFQARLDQIFATGEPCSLGSLLTDIEAGKSLRCEPRPAADGEWGIIKVSAMTWGEFRPSENKALADQTLANPDWEVREGDILVSRANTSEYVGASVLVGETRDRLLLSDKSLRLKVAHGVEPAWLQLCLSSPSVRAQISRLATGTKDSMRNISQAKLRNVQLRRVPLADQRSTVERIARLRETLRRFEAELDSQRAQAEALRRAILHRAFTGQLVPQGSSEESASKLLSRIQAQKAELKKRMGTARKAASGQQQAA